MKFLRLNRAFLDNQYFPHQLKTNRDNGVSEGRRLRAEILTEGRRLKTEMLTEGRRLRASQAVIRFFALITIFLLILLVNLPAQQPPSSSSFQGIKDISRINSPLPPSFNAVLPKCINFQPGSPILRTSEHIGGELLLAPSLDGISFITEHIKAAAKESSLIIEALIFLPNSSVEGPSSISAQLDSLGLIFNQFSSIQGIQYWSASRKIMRTIYVESYRIDNLKSRNRISDPSTASELKALLSKPMYLHQKDQTFDALILEAHCSITNSYFLMTNKNVTPVRMIGIPVLPINGLRTGFFAAPSPNGTNGILLYFVTSVQSPSIARDRVFESASNKALALLHWFIEKAFSQKLIDPVTLPWNFDDMPADVRVSAISGKI